ncbi:hypothetical protein E3T31_08085 [Cryobacterium sp. TMS1-13-1]|nr:hypothetical protein E3T31_08085 [Cryobacterium sp. TMS1-13-1]
MTSNPRDPEDGSAGIRSEQAALAAETDDVTWFDEFTIELRLLGVPGDDIGDALASAREFLADSGTSAVECFGSPHRYAAELSLPSIPLRRVNRGALLAGLGVLGLFGFLLSALPFVYGEAVKIDLVTLVVSAAVVIVVVLVPTLLTVLARLRLRPWMIVVAALLGLGTSLGLGLGGSGTVLFSIPALPIVIVSALLVLVPAIWSQASHSLSDDAIIDPGGSPEFRPSLSTRLFLGVVTWSMVAASVVVWLFALFGGPLER